MIPVRLYRRTRPPEEGQEALQWRVARDSLAGLSILGVRARQWISRCDHVGIRRCYEDRISGRLEVIVGFSKALDHLCLLEEPGCHFSVLSLPLPGTCCRIRRLQQCLRP